MCCDLNAQRECVAIWLNSAEEMIATSNKISAITHLHPQDANAKASSMLRLQQRITFLLNARNIPEEENANRSTRSFAVASRKCG